MKFHTTYYRGEITEKKTGFATHFHRLLAAGSRGKGDIGFPTSTGRP